MEAMMPRQTFERGCKFIYDSGRALDREILKFVLSGGSPQPVYVELAHYQNSDGGFGNALEPDLRTPASTAITTSTAIDFLRLIQAPDEHPIVQAMIHYLLATIDKSNWVWPIVTREIDRAPHAPWWNYSIRLPEEWNHFRFNPTAEITAFLYEHSNLVPVDVLDSLSSSILESLRVVPAPTSYYDIRCSSRLMDSNVIPQELRGQLEPWVMNAVAKLDPNDEHVNYFDLVPNADSKVCPITRERFSQAILQVIPRQRENGSWGPSWDWSEVSREAWDAASAEWSSIITRQIITSTYLHDMVSKA